MEKITELSYDRFQQFEFKPASIGFGHIPGINHKFVFPNGYGASVVKCQGSYGYDEDLFEVAVLKKITDDNYGLCYDTQITNDVLGYLSNEQVLEVLERIKNL